jgi:hypothetical protein
LDHTEYVAERKIMRAEIQALADEIGQNLALLRRHL